MYCLLNARIRALASHYANELQKTYDLRRIVLLSALSRSRERNHDEKLFIKIPISYFSIHAVLHFCKSRFRTKHCSRWFT